MLYKIGHWAYSLNNDLCIDVDDVIGTKYYMGTYLIMAKSQLEVRINPKDSMKTKKNQSMTFQK